MDMKMTDDIAVEFRNVFEKYEIEILLDGRSNRESFEALQGISLSVQKGESVAIVGPNGAGKSTILRLMAGLLKPEKGEVRINGRVGSLLDLGAGFHPELTGRDNLLLNASLYNFSRDELDSKYREILKFADIGKFINAPVRCYSQGMYVRLAFSLAIHVDPDILLIDDCLAVGDDDFRVKSIDKALEFKDQKKTIIFVTHDFSLARQMCERGIYIRNGIIVKDASVEESIACYSKPFEVDRERYKYLGAKISEDNKLKERETQKHIQMEEERFSREKEKWRREEEKRFSREKEKWRREEEERFSLEQEKWRRGEEKRRLAQEKKWEDEAARCKLEEDRRLQKQSEKRLAEHQKRTRSYVLCGDAALKVVVASEKIQVFCHDKEITMKHGLHALFTINGAESCSCGAIWKIKQVSESQLLCFIKWRKPKTIFQVWDFKLLEHGDIDLEVLVRVKKLQFIENERIELCVRDFARIFEEDLFGNKAKVLCLGKGDAVRIETSQSDKICGVAVEGEDCFHSYFLTVPEKSFQDPLPGQRIYFKGRLSAGSRTTSALGPILAVSQSEFGKTKLDFSEGRFQILRGGTLLTTGMGVYTSVYSRGVWYDSNQARWKIQEASKDRLTAEGSWPWLPIAQVWDIVLKDEGTISFEVRMKVFRETSVLMQETVMMLREEYGEWATRDERRVFPSEFTNNDLFRFCFWAHEADGRTCLAAYSKQLPSVVFEPSRMQQHQIIAENAKHIGNVKSRLFHCLKASKREDVLLKSGEYDFFKGIIHIKEEYS